MGIDVKEIQLSVKRFPGLFGKSCSTFVKKYPIHSCVFLFFFLLYMFIPSLFIFILFSIPILVFVAIAFRQIYKIHSQNLKIAKGEKRDHLIPSQNHPTAVVEAKDAVVGSKRDRSSAIIQRLPGIRRNENEKDKGLSKEDIEQENDPMSLIDNAALEDDNPKEQADSVANYAESSSTASQKLDPHEGRKPKSDGHGSEAVSVSSDEGDEEKTREERTKAVEWTEDDQKNLMDLGNSEIERNKRLESLIAKRKARKLLSMQVRRTLMNLGNNDPCNQIPRVLVPRENPYAFNESSSGQTSPVPGSAPSVLLPMHNPYDLPYDPQEEKPNLLGDSFDEDFRDHGQQKEMMFCRHESFSLGTFFPGPSEFDQSREPFFSHNFYSGPKTPEIPEYPALEEQSGEEGSGERVETEAFKESQPSERVFNHEDDVNRVQKEPSMTESSSSSSPSKTIVVEGVRESQPDEVLYDRSPSSTEKERPNHSLFYIDKREDHTCRHSIASDLQVEISELGSPVLTEDENSSPLDRESKTSEKDASANEELWVAKRKLSGVEENESKSTEVNAVSEQDIIEVGFSRIKEDSDDPGNESNVASEVKVEQDAVHSSPSSPKDDAEVHNGDQHGSFSQVSVTLPRENLADLLAREDSPQSTDKLDEDQPSYSAERSMEGSVKYDTDDQFSIAPNEAEILEFIQSTYGEVPTLIGGISTASAAIEDDTGHPENEHPHSTQHSEEEVLNTSEDNHNATGSNLEEIGPQENDNLDASVVPDVVAERGPTRSSSSSSSSSITEDKEQEISLEKSTHEANSDQEIIVTVSNGPDTGNSSSAEERVIEEAVPEPTSDSSPSVMPQESANDQVPTVLSASSSPMKEEKRLESTENSSFQDQSEGMGDNQAVLESNSDVEVLQGHDESRNTGEEDLGVGTSEAGTSEQGQTGEPAEVVVVEHVPIASSSSSSPKSVLQKDFSVASFEQMVSVGIQRSEMDAEEISTRGELPPEDSTTNSPQSVLHSVEEANTPVFNGAESSNLEETSASQGTSMEEDGAIHNENSASSNEDDKNLTSPTKKGANGGQTKHETSTDSPPSNESPGGEGEHKNEISRDLGPPDIASDGVLGGEVQELSIGAEGEHEHETSTESRPPEGEVHELRSGAEHETSGDSQPSIIAGDGGLRGEAQAFSIGAEEEPKPETSTDSPQSKAQASSIGDEEEPKHETSTVSPPSKAQALSIGAEEETKHETSMDSPPSNIASDEGPGGEVQSSGVEEKPKHETSTSSRPSNISSEGGLEGEVQELGGVAEGEPKT